MTRAPGCRALRGAALEALAKEEAMPPAQAQAASPFPELKPLGSPRPLPCPSAPQLGPALCYSPRSPWALACPSGPLTQQQPGCSSMELGPVDQLQSPSEWRPGPPCQPPTRTHTPATSTFFPRRTRLKTRLPAVSSTQKPLPSLAQHLLFPQLSSKSLPPKSLPNYHPVYPAPPLPLAVLHAQCNAG